VGEKLSAGRSAVARTAALAVAALAIVSAVAGVTLAWPRLLQAMRAGSPAPPRDVILISIDTLRADHLGCYGYPFPTSPNIDRFSQDAVRFAQNISAAPATLISHASMMTSLLPAQHGADFLLHRALAPRFLTLAGVFRRHGYGTVSYNDGGQITAALGMANGFDLYRSSPRTAFKAFDFRFADTVARAVGCLTSHAASPLFLFLHSYEVHHPYTPEARFRAVMEPTPYLGPLPAAQTDMATLIAIRDGRLHIGPRDLTHIVATYDGEIRSMDEAFGQLVAFLKRSGRYDQALIVFTSDHGEEFAEHGAVGWHAHTLYDELLRVPLLIKFPNGLYAGETVTSQVREIDIAPTVVSAMGWPLPPEFRGADLTPLAEGRAAQPRFAVSQMESLVDASLRMAPWKLYDGRLYDLASDPGEKRDVAAQHPDLAAALGRRLHALLAEQPAAAGPAVTLSAEERSRLRALGYLP
jgi:arylsulfatase A-like enzyme